MKSKDRIKREESEQKEAVKTMRAELRKLQKELKAYNDDPNFLKIFKRVEKLEEENNNLKKKLKNIGKVLKKKSNFKTDEEMEKVSKGKCSCGGDVKVIKIGAFFVRFCEKCKKREKI
jgi:hypothetical protein